MRPSKIKLATAVDTWWVPSSFVYVMLKGKAYTNNPKTVEKFNATEDNEDHVHETIHVRQAVSMKDSWLRFYLEYLWEWLHNLPLITVKWHAAYKFMPMELEAYCFQNQPEYIDREMCDAWKDFKEIQVKTLKQYAKLWYKGDGDGPYRYKMTFSEFIKKYITKHLPE